MKNLICISAPSGSGKTTLCKLVREVKPELIWSFLVLQGIQEKMKKMVKIITLYPSKSLNL